MAGKVRTYNPKEVLVSLGTHPVSGLADDSFIDITPNGGGITTQVGCDGEIINSLDPNSTATIKLVLLQESLTNVYLEKMYKIYNEKGLDTGMFPVTIKDLRGGTLDSCEQAWVKKHANRSYGKAASNREWEIGTGEFSFNESAQWK